MLQPRSYPELIGKALVLEPDPFVTMVDDDNPWAEGLFLVVLVGVAVGVARWIGGLLMAASLPPANAVLEVVLQGWRQLAPTMAGGSDPAATEAAIRQTWALATGLLGYGGGWTSLVGVVLAPMALLIQWLAYGLASYGMARAMGGHGRLNQTLGATALIVAPQILRLLAVIPFVSVSGLLLAAWDLLIVYRAIEVAHELPWKKAALAALAAPALLALLAFGVAAMMSALLMLGGAA